MTPGAVPRIVVVGSGSLTRSVCYSIGTEFRSPAEVVVLARSAEKAERIAFIAGVRASLSQVPVSFRAEAADLGDAADDAADLDRALGASEPSVVVNCALNQVTGHAAARLVHGLAAGFPVAELRRACTELLQLRQRLRAA